MQALQDEVTQLKDQVGQREKSAAATEVQMRQLEQSLGQASSSLVVLTDNLAAAKTTDLEVLQVCCAAFGCILSETLLATFLTLNRHFVFNKCNKFELTGFK